MSESQQLQFQRGPTPKPEGDQRNYRGQDRYHAGHDKTVGAKLQCFQATRNYEQAQASRLADSYFEAGFTVVIAETLVGRLDHIRADIKGRPLLLVNLAPALDIVKRRNEERPNKNVFEPWAPTLGRAMRETLSGIGLWLDCSNQFPDETVYEILRRAWNEGALG